MRGFEQLEARTYLTASCDTVDDEIDDGLSTEVSQLLNGSDDTFSAAEAGSTLATAADLGTLGAARSYAGYVGGTDPSDIMRFTVSAGSQVSVQLAGLSADIDLYLYNSSGQQIAYSNKASLSAESISQSLEAGQYYLVVVPWGRAASNYTLTVGATARATPTPTTPTNPTAPTTPTTPTSPTTPTAPTSPTTVTPFADVAYYGGANDWNLNAINAPEAWAQGYTGEGVTVAVIDTGVDLDHPDLNDQIWVNPGEIAGNNRDDDNNGYVDDVYGWDFVSNDNNPDDGNGHGTHVAGTIAAEANGTGATGVAPGAAIMPVRVLGSDGSGTAQGVAAGIRYAVDAGADIINLSLGGAFSSVIQTAIQYAQQHNVLVVVAAGNESASTPSYPARFSAALNNVLSVGAHNSNNTIASFSNDVGSSGAVQVDAPGVSIYSTYLGGGYRQLNGTSMATPHVAGLAALALSANPNLTAAQLRTLIVEGTSRSITGSDSTGGINAALSVAMAAAGQTTASVSTAVAQTASQAPVFAASHRRVSAAEGRAELAPTLGGAAQPSSAQLSSESVAPAALQSATWGQVRLAAASATAAREAAIAALLAYDAVDWLAGESDERAADCEIDDTLEVLWQELAAA